MGIKAIIRAGDMAAGGKAAKAAMAKVKAARNKHIGISRAVRGVHIAVVRKADHPRLRNHLRSLTRPTIKRQSCTYNVRLRPLQIVVGVLGTFEQEIGLPKQCAEDIPSHWRYICPISQ